MVVGTTCGLVTRWSFPIVIRRKVDGFVGARCRQAARDVIGWRRRHVAPN